MRGGAEVGIGEKMLVLTACRPIALPRGRRPVASAITDLIDDLGALSVPGRRSRRSALRDAITSRRFYVAPRAVSAPGAIYTRDAHSFRSDSTESVMSMNAAATSALARLNRQFGLYISLTASWAMRFVVPM